jgi:hypothetical protein
MSRVSYGIDILLGGDMTPVHPPDGSAPAERPSHGLPLYKKQSVINVKSVQLSNSLRQRARHGAHGVEKRERQDWRPLAASGIVMSSENDDDEHKNSMDHVSHASNRVAMYLILGLFLVVDHMGP